MEKWSVDKVDYIYDSEGKVLSTTSVNFMTNSTWTNSYDANGVLVKSSLKEGESEVLSKTNFKTYTFDPKSHLLLKTNEVEQEKENGDNFRNKTGETNYIYKDGKLVEKNFKPTSGRMPVVTKFNEKNLVTETVIGDSTGETSYKKGEYVYYSIDRYTYDDNNNILTNYSHSTEDGEFLNRTKNIYEYDSNKNWTKLVSETKSGIAYDKKYSQVWRTKKERTIEYFK